MQHKQFMLIEHEQSIQEYKCEISRLDLLNTELKLKHPSLEAQIKTIKEILEAKQEECHLLEV